MTLTIKKFRIPSEIIEKLEMGKDPLPTDLNRAIKDDDRND